MDEALNIFKEISNLSYFKRSALILFLNKVDLLEEKLGAGMSPIQRYDTKYTGGATDVKAAKEYFAKRFESLIRDPKKYVYIHYTDATDTEQLNVTMTSVRATIMQHQFETLIL